MSTTDQGLQMDMGRVVQRATGALADIAVAPLAAELGAAREVIDLQQRRIAELEQTARDQAETHAAELARAHQTSDALQQRLTELEQTTTD